MNEMEQLILLRLEEMNQKLTGLDQKLEEGVQIVTGTQLSLENEISKKICIISDGHDLLKRKLDNALQMEKKCSSMELEMLSLQLEINKIKEYLNIA